MLEEETVDGFLRGFDNFRRQMARICPQFDLSTICPRMKLGYGSDSDDVPATLASEGGSAKSDAAEPAAAEPIPRETNEGVSEAPAEAAAADSEPAPAGDPPVVAVDSPEGGADGTAVP